MRVLVFRRHVGTCIYHGSCLYITGSLAIWVSPSKQRGSLAGLSVATPCNWTQCIFFICSASSFTNEQTLLLVVERDKKSFIHLAQKSHTDSYHNNEFIGNRLYPAAFASCFSQIKVARKFIIIVEESLDRKFGQLSCWRKSSKHSLIKVHHAQRKHWKQRTADSLFCGFLPEQKPLYDHVECELHIISRRMTVTVHWLTESVAIQLTKWRV